MAMGWATDDRKLRRASVATIANRYARAAVFERNTGRLRFTLRRSRYPASWPIRSRRHNWRALGRAAFLGHIEIELDQHVVGVGEENLRSGSCWGPD